MLALPAVVRRVRHGGFLEGIVVLMLTLVLAVVAVLLVIEHQKGAMERLQAARAKSSRRRRDRKTR